MAVRLTFALAAACAAGAELGETPLHSAAHVGFTNRWGELSESKRLELRDKAGWKWSFPGEPPAYREWQESRTLEINDLYHYQERLDNWVQYTQVRSVRNFTRLGFDVVDAPPELHAQMRQKLLDGLKKGPRQEMGGRGKLQGIYGESAPQFVDHGEPGLLGQLQPLHEEWAPEAGPLSPAAAYGMRVYRRGASLAWHADRVDTHVISSIFHIDHKYDNESEPWPIEIEGHDGLRHAVSLKPGQMLLYESAKCPHGRSTNLKGDWYASIFSHFTPGSDIWPYTMQDVWLAVPPGWDTPPITHSGSGRWAGAFLTHDAMEVPGMPPRDARELHHPPRLRPRLAPDAEKLALGPGGGLASSGEGPSSHYEAERAAAAKAALASLQAEEAAEEKQKISALSRAVASASAAAKAAGGAAAQRWAKAAGAPAHGEVDLTLPAAPKAAPGSAIAGALQRALETAAKAKPKGFGLGKPRQKRQAAAMGGGGGEDAESSEQAEARATQAKAAKKARKANHIKGMALGKQPKSATAQAERRRAQAAAGDEGDELFEAAEEAGVVGLLALALWALSPAALFAGGCVLVRRCCLTRGRSLTRRKVKDDRSEDSV